MAKKDEVKAVEKVAASMPALNTITKDYESMLGPYHTINIPRGQKDPRYLPIQVLGSLPDGRPVNFRWLIQRGVDVNNVPNCALGVLKNAVETNYTFVMKDQNKLADGEQAHDVVSEKNQSYPFMVKESYPMRKAGAAGPKAVENNG